MRWQGRTRSGNVRDRRSVGLRVAGGGVGLLLVLALSLVLGVDPGTILQEGDPGAPGPGTAADDESVEFVEVVLASTERTWHELFRRNGVTYEEPVLVLFSGAVRSACGLAGAAVGPFYCPADRQVYLDLSFFHDLERTLGAPGDFARAYVISHEVGHHVQNLLGTVERVAEARRGLSDREANALSVMMELQADCFAGIWGFDARREAGFLEPGDIDEGLAAAAAIGDDRLQRRSQGQVVPETFTHGTSEQRARWFRRGLESGSPDACDTFSGA